MMHLFRQNRPERRSCKLQAASCKFVMAVVLVLSMQAGVATAASSWAPTLLVNTEAFQVIDDRDSANNLVLRFGETVNETLTWNRTLGVFQFSDDLYVQGTLSGSTLTIDRNATFAASGVIITSSGQTVFNEQSRPVDFRVEGDNDANAFFVDASSDFVGIGKVLPKTKLDVLGTISGSVVYGNQSLRSSGSLVFEGAASGSSLYLGSRLDGAGLSDCDAAGQKLLWDSSTGRFSCGTDASGSFGTGNVLTIGDSRYVNVSGDTMTGALTVQNGNTHTPTTTPLINVRGTMSGQGIWISGTGAKLNPGTNSGAGKLPLIATDLDFGSVVIGTGGLRNIGSGTMLPQFYVGTRPQPVWVGSGSIGIGASKIVIQGNYAYVGDEWNGGITTLDISTPQRLKVTAQIAPGFGIDSMDVQGRYLYAADNWSSQMHIYDISKPTALGIVGSYSSSSVYSVAVEGRYAYVDSGYLDVVDISDPTNPVRVGRTKNFIGSNENITVQGNYVYSLGYGNSSFYITDVSNPHAPFIASTTTSGISNPASLAVQGRYAYIGNSGGLNNIAVFDISNPAAPTLAGTVGLGGSAFPESMQVHGRYLYVANSNRMLQFDISNPAQPTFVGMSNQNVSTIIDIAVQGRYAYAIDYNSKAVQAFDLGGAYIQQFEAGGAQVGQLDVRTNATVFGNLDVGGGVSFGHGFAANGPSAITNTATGGFALTISSNTGGLKIAADGRSVSPHLLFGTGTTFDTNLFRISANTLHTDDAFSVSGALMLESSLTGATIGGFGLTDCDNATTSKLLWDSATGKFSCGTDQSGGSFGTGNVLTIGDGRYVNVSGDTMTGALNIRVTGGTPTTQSLNVAGLMSGTSLQITGTGSSSAPILFTNITRGVVGIGTNNPIDPLHIVSDVNSDAINIEENVGGESWQIGVDVDGDLNFENSTSASITFSDTNNVGIGATSPSNKLEVVGSISGAVVIGTDSLRSSGSLVFEGAASGSSLYLGSRLDGAGLSDCDAAGQKLLWDSSTGRFSCGTDASGSFGTGNVLTIGDSRYVNTSGDTMTGALNINLTSGFRALNIAQWASGAYLHAEKGLSSSGGLVVEGAVTFGSTLNIGGVTYTFPGSDGAGSGYVLATNGAGQLSWAQLGTGSLKTRTLQIAVPLNTAAVTRDGADNDVNVYIGSQTGATTNPHQYYRVATASGQLQDIDIRYKVQLPQDFINFTTLTNDIRVSYRTTSASASVNALDILVEDDDGDDAYTASEGEDLTSVSWTDFVNEFDGGSFNPAPGEYIYVTIKGYATSSGDAYAGEILITYTGK